MVFPKQLVDWLPIRVLIPQGARVPRLIAEIAYRLGFSFDVDALSNASHQVFRGKVRKLLQKFFEKPRRALVIDDLHQILRDATARDVRHLSTFIEEASTADAVVGGKILLLSSQWLKQEWLNRKGVKHVQLKRIQDLYVTRILEFRLRRSGVISGEAVPEPPQELLDVIRGHPLSARLAVQSLQTINYQQLSEQLKQVASSGYIARELLKHVTLTDADRNVLSKLAVFRLPVRTDLMKQIPSLTRNVQLLENLSTRAIVSYDGVSFELHEAIRRYFYAQIKLQETAEFHRAAVDYYQAIYDMTTYPRLTKKDPSIVCELIHHLVMAGRKLQADQVRNVVIDELKQTARAIYKERREYHRALEIYRMMAEIAPDDVQVVAYVGRCYARLQMWGASDDAFIKATSLAKRAGNRVGWLYRDWGHIRARYQFYSEARKHLDAALEHDPADPSTIAALGYLSWREGDYEAAKENFDNALRLNPEHLYTLIFYPRFLRQRGQYEYANELDERMESQREDQRYVSRLEDVEELEYDEE